MLQPQAIKRSTNVMLVARKKDMGIKKMAAQLSLFTLEVHVTSHTKTTMVRDEFYRMWNRKKYFMQALISCKLSQDH